VLGWIADQNSFICLLDGQAGSLDLFGASLKLCGIWPQTRKMAQAARCEYTRDRSKFGKWGISKQA